MSIEVREIDGRQWKYCHSCHTYHGKQKCQWCGKGYKTPHGLREHERICFLNPKRKCDLCYGEGGYGVPALGPGLGVIFDADWKDCEACAEAKKRRDLHWWAKYGDEVPEDERQFTCAEAQAKLAEEGLR